jgi:predicted XRE-type DNA-binding protein
MSPSEAAYYEGRAQLVIQIREHLRKKKWTQERSAKACGVSQPRINDLLRGRIDKFSIDALVRVAAHLGLRASFELKAA